MRGEKTVLVYDYYIIHNKNYTKRLVVFTNVAQKTLYIISLIWSLHIGNHIIREDRSL